MSTMKQDPLSMIIYQIIHMKNVNKQFLEISKAWKAYNCRWPDISLSLTRLFFNGLELEITTDFVNQIGLGLY